MLAGREVQKARKDDKAHEQRQPDLRHGRGKQRHADAVHGKAGHEDFNDNGAPAGPDAGVGFAVIFAHDLINVGVVLSGFLDKMHLSFFFLYDNYGREALP